MTQAQAETLVAVHGLVDGLYLREMAAKIRRGLTGQFERGFSTGAIRYGYKAVPVPDPEDVEAYRAYGDWPEEQGDPRSQLMGCRSCESG